MGFVVLDGADEALEAVSTVYANQTDRFDQLASPCGLSTLPSFQGIQVKTVDELVVNLSVNL